jgi:hypothetical protein
MTKAIAKPKSDRGAGKAGRPKASIEPDHVEALAKAGCTVEEMAAFLKVNKKTLERRFTKTIDLRRLQPRTMNFPS